MKKVESLVVRIFNNQYRIKRLEEENKRLKQKLAEYLRGIPDNKIIVVHPKMNIKIQAQIVSYERWEIDPREFYARYSGKIDVLQYMKVDGNKVREALQNFGIFNFDEIKNIVNIEKTEYVSIREIKHI